MIDKIITKHPKSKQYTMGFHKAQSNLVKTQVGFSPDQQRKEKKRVSQIFPLLLENQRE
jgi:Zn-dependent M32 family carboxypeptidase